MACTHAPKDPAAPAAHEAEHHADHKAAHGHGHGGGHGMPHRFEDAQKWAEVFDDPARDAWQKPDEVVAALKLAPDDVVADLGAGTGYFAVRLAKHLPRGRVFGIDVEPTLVRHLEERARQEGLSNLRGVVCPADDAALPEPVDLVLVVDTYHHLQDRPRYFRKVRASLRPGGRVVVIDFTRESPHGPPPSERLTAEDVSRELWEAGFGAPQAAAVSLPHQYFLSFAARP
jgi:cyclopropane fatty-acyl-phospholipid synthase-like methyltransferase